MKLDNDKITVNSPNLLAFEAGIDWDIRKVEGASGVLAGGLFNLELSGSGWVALLLRRPADAAPAEGRPGVRRPSGRDHVVERREDLGQDRHEPEDADRPRLRRDAPDGVLRRRLAAGAALRGPRQRRGRGIRSRRRPRRPARRARAPWQHSRGDAPASSSCGGRAAPRTSARSPSCARRWRRRAWTRSRRGAPRRHRRGGGARGVRRVTHDPHRRARPVAATGGRAGWANVPRLPVARRPRLADSRSGRRARRSDRQRPRAG